MRLAKVRVVKSGSYSATTYKTAYLKKYYPVEWSVACLMTHDKTEKIVATISDLKRMGYQVLPPDINKSNANFSIEVLQDGSKAIRYGLNGIKNVGVRVVDFITKYRPFTSLQDFYTKVHDKNIQREVNPDTGKLMNNPLDKTVEVSLIEAGAFDSIEENRYHLKNQYMLSLRKDKDYVQLNPKDYTRKVKLELEKQYMGSYISEHPLDPFPYEDMDSLDDNDEIEIAGIIKSVTKKTAKNNREFANVIMESKDGKDVKVSVFGKVFEKYKSRLVKGEIIIVEGEVSKQWNNINAYKIKKMVRTSSTNKQSEETDFIPPVRYDTFSLDGNPVDDIMNQYGGL